MPDKDTYDSEEGQGSRQDTPDSSRGIYSSRLNMIDLVNEGRLILNSSSDKASNSEDASHQIPFPPHLVEVPVSFIKLCVCCIV
jgi:hypothetical protein